MDGKGSYGWSMRLTRVSDWAPSFWPASSLCPTVAQSARGRDYCLPRLPLRLFRPRGLWGLEAWVTRRERHYRCYFFPVCAFHTLQSSLLSVNVFFLITNTSLSFLFATCNNLLVLLPHFSSMQSFVLSFFLSFSPFPCQTNEITWKHLDIMDLVFPHLINFH